MTPSTLSTLMPPKSHIAAQLSGPEREGVVQRMFSSIARRYDLNNTILSFGLHHRWKRKICRMVAEASPTHTIDIGAGTCDLSLMLASEFPSIGRVMAVDLNASMLGVGKAKICKAQSESQIWCFRGNAESLSFRDNVFDAAIAGFCIRNVGDLDMALHEVYRILKPGGQFFCLEFSRPTSSWLRAFYDVYSLHVLPWVGTWVAGDSTEVYRYLPASIWEFPDQDALAERMQRAGFSSVDYRNVSGGIVAIHRAIK